MRKYIWMCVALFLPVPAMAASCMDLWVARNAIFNAHGYCFSTNLGKSFFDNSDCYTKNARLSKRERRQVSRIKRAERSMGCRINTRMTASSGRSVPAARSRRTRAAAPSYNTQKVDTQVYSCRIECFVDYGKPKMIIKVRIRAAGGSRASRDAIDNGSKYCKKKGAHHASYVTKICDQVGW